jgi:hypothetical protein
VRSVERHGAWWTGHQLTSILLASVFLNHSIKKVTAKVLVALQDPKASLCAAAQDELDVYLVEVGKAELVASSCAAQLSDYRALERKVKALVESTSSEIYALSVELRLAKKVRAHKEEYEALAKLVNEHASKPKSLAEQEELQEELRKLEEEKARLDEQVPTFLPPPSYGSPLELTPLLFGRSGASAVSAVCSTHGNDQRPDGDSRRRSHGHSGRRPREG